MTASDPTILTAVLVGAAAFSIGLSKSGLAGAIGPLATILMLWALPAKAALGVLLPLLLAGDMIAMTLLWRRWDARIIRELTPGVIAGVIAGTVLLDAIPASSLRVVIGLLAISFGVWAFVIELRGRALRRISVQRPLAAFAAGTVTGASSTIAHAGGPPMTMYLLTQRLDPRTFVATSALAFAVVNLLKVPFYAAVGIFDPAAQLHYLWAFALIPVGAILGQAVLDHVPRRTFRLLMTVFLLVGGAALVAT